MAYFRSVGGSGTGATITVAYSSEFYGETITCSHGTKTYSKVAPSTGTVDFTVYEEGTWTISCTIGAETYSTTANIDLTASAVLDAIPNGETVTPTDDIETWLACAGITDKTYTALSQVLADSETYNALLGDSNACAYMERSTTWSTDICASQYAMNLLGQYDTACDALLSDSTWASAIANSTYFESVLNVKVPVMTSNTTPEGVCFASSEYSSAYAAWKAFNGSTTGSWSPTSGSTNQYIGYQFLTGVCVKRVDITRAVGGNNDNPITLKMSDDGSTWTSIGTGTLLNNTNLQTFITTSNAQEKAYMAVEFANYTGGEGIGIIQFYGRTTSSEMVHGANGESAYILDGGSPVTITDPSTLNAGTYTFYSTVAKNPSDLTADYSKTIRICPNTKEIVVRPDNTLYWWGYNGGIQNMSSSDGWSISDGWLTPTWNNTNITLNSASSKNGGVASIYQISTKTIAYVGKFTSTSNSDRVGVRLLTSKSSADYATNCAIHCTVPDSVVEYDSATVVSDTTGWLTAMVGWGSGSKMELYALLYE